MTELERQELQIDFAWKWFVYHADQRMKAFNFMIVTFGILAAALASAVGNKLYPLGAGLSFMAAVVAFLFWLLDRRNRDLIWAGQAVLEELESTLLFGTRATQTGVAGDVLGIFARIPSLTDELPPDVKSKMVECPDRLNAFKLGMHRVIIPAFAWLFIIMSSLAFFILMSLALQDEPSQSAEIAMASFIDTGIDAYAET